MNQQPPGFDDHIDYPDLYQRLTQNLHGLVYRVFISQNKQMRFLNENLFPLTGYTSAELSGGGGLDRLILPEDREDVIREVEQAVAANRPFAVEYRLRHKDGGIRYLLDQGVPVHGDDGHPHSIDGVIFDITSQKHPAEALRDELTKRIDELNTAQRMANLGSFLLNIRNGTFTNSPILDEIFGIGPEYPHTVEGWLRLVAADQQEEMLGYLEQSIRHGERFEREYRIVRPNDHAERWLTATGEVECDEKGPLRMRGAVQDITELKETEISLKNSENMLTAIIDTAPECVKLLDAEARLIMMNRAGLAMIQADDLAQVKGQCVCPMIASEHWDAFMDLTNRVFKGESETLVFEMVGLKGRHLWLETHAVPFRNEKDEIIALLGVTRDITAKRQAEEALIQSRERFRTLYDETPILLHSIDRSGTVVNVNKHWLRTLGYERDEVMGRKVTEFYTEASRRYAEEVLQPTFFRDGFCNDVALQFVKKNGEVVDVLLSATGERDAAGKVVRSRSVIKDVTDRRRLEAEQLKTQKLEAIGTLAGGIAHDFNNLLQGVFGYLSLAKVSIDKKGEVLAALEQAEKALVLSTQLTMQLLTFSKGGRPVKNRIDLKAVIENAAKFALSGSSCTASCHISDGLWRIEADEGQVSRVIQNIVLNAAQAMPKGGRIELSAKNLALPDPTLPLDLPEGDYVAVAIKDNGPGIAAQHLARIFDPYFSTKEQGSGLGLATSYSIIKNHDGMLAVHSELGVGTTFCIYLPATAKEAPVPESVPEPAATTRTTPRTGRVLVMDDEQVIRDVANRMITALGHQVESAAHGEEAIAKYRAAQQAGTPFDIVILDLTIRGGMGGFDTMRKLLAIDPQVKAVVSSGYSDDATLSAYQSHGFKSSLNKPYSLQALRDALKKLI